MNSGYPFRGTNGTMEKGNQWQGAAHGETMAIREALTTSEGELRVYVEGDLGGQEPAVLLGNQLCEAELLPCEGLRTWILADNSDSIPLAEREIIRQQLCGFFLQPGSSEEIRFSIFGEEAELINDFSGNMEALTTTAEDLRYEDQNSYVWKILKEAAKELESMEREHCSSRLLLITDGGESSPGSVTPQETAEALERSGIPLYVLGCGNNSDKLNTLARIARSSGGEFLHCAEAEDAESLRSLLSRELTLWQVAVPPESWDGTSKWLQLSGSADGKEFTVQRSVTFPQRAMPTATLIPPTAAPTPTVTVTPVPAILTEPPTAAEQMLSLIHHGAMPAAVGILLGVLAGAGLYYYRKRRGRELPKKEPLPLADAPEDPGLEKVLCEEAIPGGIVSGEATPRKAVQEDPETQLLYGRTDEVTLVLRDVTHSERTLRRKISGRITFGKEPSRCDWVIAQDPSISRCHGRFSVRDQELWVEDLNSRNGIWVNRRRITSMTGLRSQDLLRIGDSEFRVLLEEEEQ